MTSLVKVSAHCASDKEVVFSVGEDISILQNGETADKHIYDQRYAVAFERSKAEDGQQTFGEKAVGLGFNPSGSDLVTRCKRTYAISIDAMHDLRNSTQDPEVKRMASLAITEAQTAQMWAVKALTWK